jgi:hypothetical protein
MNRWAIFVSPLCGRESHPMRRSSRQQLLIEAFEGLAIALEIIQVVIQFYFPLTGEPHELRRGYRRQLSRSARGVLL